MPLPNTDQTINSMRRAASVARTRFDKRRPDSSNRDVLRTSYKQTWNALSTNRDQANEFVSGIDNEAEVRTNGTATAAFLKRVLRIRKSHRVLEIGCGVARVGRELAPMCGQWVGCDISGNMIHHARDRTSHLNNVVLEELPTNDLSIFEDDTFDSVYSTIVFMHVDKTDVYKYIREARRVLKPGGRAYFDTYNLLAPEAWDIFENLVDEFEGGERPRHMSQFSTPQEFQMFMEKAGFAEIEVVDKNPQLVTALAVCPE